MIKTFIFIFVLLNITPGNETDQIYSHNSEFSVINSASSIPWDNDSVRVACDEDCNKLGNTIRLGMYILILSIIPIGIFIYVMD